MPATQREVVKRLEVISSCMAELGFSSPIDIDSKFRRDGMSIKTLPDMAINLDGNIGFQFFECYLIESHIRRSRNRASMLPDEYQYKLIDLKDDFNAICRFEYSSAHVPTIEKEFHPIFHLHLRDYDELRFPTPRVDFFSVFDFFLRNYHEKKWSNKNKCKSLHQSLGYFKLCRDCEYSQIII